MSLLNPKQSNDMRRAGEYYETRERNLEYAVGHSTGLGFKVLGLGFRV